MFREGPKGLPVEARARTGSPRECSRGYPWVRVDENRGKRPYAIASADDDCGLALGHVRGKRFQSQEVAA